MEGRAVHRVRAHSSATTTTGGDRERASRGRKRAVHRVRAHSPATMATRAGAWGSSPPPAVWKGDILSGTGEQRLSNRRCGGRHPLARQAATSGRVGQQPPTDGVVGDIPGGDERRRRRTNERTGSSTLRPPTVRWWDWVGTAGPMRRLLRPRAITLEVIRGAAAQALSRTQTLVDLLPGQAGDSAPR